MPLTIFNYHPETGEFISSSLADKSPLEPDEWLIPAHATEIEPPQTVANQVAVFDGNAWRIDQDFRGLNLYSTENGSRVEVDTIGPMPTNATTDPRPSIFYGWSSSGWALNLDQMRAGIKNTIDVICGDKRAAIVSPGSYIAEEYRRAYDDAIEYKLGGYTGTVPASVQSWATTSGITATQSADDIIATRNTYMQILDAIREIRLSAKADIDAANNETEILAVVAAVNAALAAVAS